MSWPAPMGRVLRTARLVLAPVSWADFDEVAALKGDPGAYGMMLGGLCSRAQAAEEMGRDIAFWGRHGMGIFTIREQGRFLGITGVHERPDGLGLALRFALWPHASGRGVGREAAAAALRFAHDQGAKRVIAVARETNFASRTILGGIGMRQAGAFDRAGHRMIVYESILG